jgi:hypothetical protein
MLAYDQVFLNLGMKTHTPNVKKRHPALKTKPLGNIKKLFRTPLARVPTKALETYVEH